MALALVGWLGSGGSAAPTSDRPTKQELARKLLATKGLHLTPAARAFVARVAAGGERAAEPEGAEARAKAGIAAAAGPAVRPTDPGLGNVRVNDPARDRHQQDQTTQSETTIAVAGRNVAVGYNDSQQSLLFTTQGSSLSGYSYSRDGGRTFTDGGPLPNRPGYVNFGDPWLTSDRARRMDYATLAGTTNFNLGVSVARSTNGGRSWSAPLQVSPGDPPVDLYIGDKEAITAGRGPSRPGRDVLYMAWDDLFFSATDILSGLPSGSRSTTPSARARSWSPAR
jgi:hypothetical protein